MLIDAIGGHVDGLVVAALGAGHVPADTVTTRQARRAHASRAGLPDRRWPSPSPDLWFPGSETDLLARGLISAGYLAPVKARLLLHLLIASRAGTTRIKETFATAGGVA